MALTFAGASKVESIGGGMLKVYWAVATGGTVGSYNIYVRNSNSSVFSSTYLLAKVPNTLLFYSLRFEADSSTFLINGTTYHIGVKAEESGGSEDSNVVVKSGIPVGDGSLPLESPDRKVGIFI